jgi:arylsulfatase A-like enzyme
VTPSGWSLLLRFGRLWFGKNHLGDLNKYLPTVHGFDEFFGNLYHLNAEEEARAAELAAGGRVPRVRPALCTAGRYPFVGD